MIEFQGPEGIEFWSPHAVASLMPEFRNWWRGVRADGRVAHRPTPPPPGPYFEYFGGYVNPRWLSSQADGWKDPGDYTFPPAVLPDPAVEPPSPVLPELGLPAIQVYALTKVTGKKHVIWHTDSGELLWEHCDLEKSAGLHPDLFFLRQNVHLNRRRLFQIRSNKGFRRFFRLDNGVEFSVTSSTAPLAAKRLGLPNLLQLEPSCSERFGDYLLRDWPVELARASRAFLRQHFKSPRQLIGNLIWQRFRYRLAGLTRRWSASYRDFWYDVVAHVLFRAGFLEAEEARREVSFEPDEPIRGKVSRSEELFRMTYQIMDFFVDYCGFFNFRQFGFKDPEPKLFKPGLLRPEIVLITEKDDCLEYAARLVREFGVSHYHLGGQPSLLRSEYVAERLLRVLRCFWGIAYVDYDAGGWALGRAAANQLERQGLEVRRFDYLIREDCFTEEEKLLHSHPCKMGGLNHKSKVANWIARGGGLAGQARGIYASQVDPYARIRTLFVNLLQEED